jgi:hypothetical protein
MAKLLPIVNEDYELGCADSLMADVDLSGLTDACFIPVKATNLSVGGKAVLTSLTITATAATGSITTSLIDGTNIVFVSASGTIQGSATKVTTGEQPVCLADEDITGATAATYTENGSIGTLTVIGSNTSTGAAVTDVCNVWFSSAGQDKAKGK